MFLFWSTSVSFLLKSSKIRNAPWPQEKTAIPTRVLHSPLISSKTWHCYQLKAAWWQWSKPHPFCCQRLIGSERHCNTSRTKLFWSGLLNFYWCIPGRIPSGSNSFADMCRRPKVLFWRIWILWYGIFTKYFINLAPLHFIQNLFSAHSIYSSYTGTHENFRLNHSLWAVIPRSAFFV